MGDANYYPDRWKEYVASLKKEGKEPAQEWAIFAARYRVAGNYCSASFFSLSEKTAKGYSEAIRLLLAYSAFEAACNASGRKPNECPVPSEEGFPKEARILLQKAFNKTPEAEFPLRHALNPERLAGKIDAFLEGKEHNLQPIASALRHLFAHGIWTPHGADALSKTSCDALDVLSQSLLWAADRLFESSNGI